MKILKPMEIQQADKWVKFEPHDGFKVALTIEFDHPVLINHHRVLRLILLDKITLKKLRVRGHLVLCRKWR